MGRRCKAAFQRSGPVLAYLGRFNDRVAIANSRVVELDDDHVAFRWKDYRCNGCDREKIQQNEAIRDWLAEHRKARTQSIIDRVNTGKQSGEIPAHVDEVAIGDCCATLLHGLSVQARDGIETRRLHAMVDAFPIAFDSMVSAR